MLDCAGNSLTELDLSNNAALTWLYCELNWLTTLDVSNNIGLEGVICYRNELTTLNVMSNIRLIVLVLDHNRLETLDVSNNKLLEYLSCRFNVLGFPANVIGWDLSPMLILSDTFIFFPQRVPRGEDITSAFTDPAFLRVVRETLRKGENEPIYERLGSQKATVGI